MNSYTFLQIVRICALILGAILYFSFGFKIAVIVLYIFVIIEAIATFLQKPAVDPCVYKIQQYKKWKQIPVLVAILISVPAVLMNQVFIVIGIFIPVIFVTEFVYLRKVKVIKSLPLPSLDEVQTVQKENPGLNIEEAVVVLQNRKAQLYGSNPEV